MIEISEQLEKSIRRSNDLVKSSKRKMYPVEKHLSMKEKVYMHGLYVFMGDNPEVTDAELKKVIKSHPIKFWPLKDLSKEMPEFLAELREHGYFYICNKIETSRGISQKREQTEKDNV